MDDDDIAAIRAKRLAQLQSQGGGGGGPSRGPPPSTGGQGGMGGEGGGQGGESQEEQLQKQRQEEEQLRGIMATLLEPGARERLARIQMTRPQLSRQVQSILLRMAQGGQLRGKVSDEQLVGLLEQAERAGGGGGGGGGGGAPSKIIFHRKGGDDSDDSDFDM